MSAKPTTSDTGPLIEFMLQLARAYLTCGEQTAEVERILRRIMTARGLRRPRVLIFPTSILIAAADSSGEHVSLSEGSPHGARLDQIAAIYALGREAQRGGVPPQEGLKRLDEIARMKPRFGTVGTILGHVVLTIGLATALMPLPENIAMAAVLGLLIGILHAVNGDRPIFSAPLSVVASGVVATIVFLGVKYGLPIDPVYVLIPPLVTFLPGGMLAFGLVELTTDDMVSGASRLLKGLVQLILLAFGLTSGALLVGYQPYNLLDGQRDVNLPIWTALLGATLFVIGVFVHYSGPRRSLPWLLIVVCTAFAIQRFTAEFVGAAFSGFFGMAGATILGNVVEDWWDGPPSMVTFLPSFWFLVPGVLGLLGVKRLLTGHATVDCLFTVVFAFTSIALGTLVGESIYKRLLVKRP